MTPHEVPTGPRELTALGRWARWRPPEWDDGERRRVLDQLFFEGPERRPYLSRFFSLMVLSTTIAALGLVADSAAVVIGAMLVAPLMTPILAVGGAAVHGQPGRLVASVAVLLGGTLSAIVTGAVVAAVAPGAILPDELSAELAARTAPGLLDLGIAVAAGLAGGYVLTHPRAGSSLPGVAIAVALVPPLATVGVTLQIGATGEALGALLLFSTNMAAIVLSVMTVMIVSGFVPSEIRRTARRRVRVGFAAAGAAVVAVAVPLTVHTIDVVADERLRRTTLAAVDEWDPAGRVVSITGDTTAGRATVDLVMASSRAPAPAWRLAEMVSVAIDAPVDVTVEYRLEQRDEATAG